MNKLVRFFASNALKLGVAYTVEIIGIVLMTIKNILSSAQISDDARQKLQAAQYALHAVHQFLIRLQLVIGSPTAPAQASYDLLGSADKLTRISDSL